MTKHLFRLVLGTLLLFAACQKAENQGPSDGFNPGNSITPGTVGFNPGVSLPGQAAQGVALAAFRMAIGDSLVGGTDERASIMQNFAEELAKSQSVQEREMDQYTGSRTDMKVSGAVIITRDTFSGDTYAAFAAFAGNRYSFTYKQEIGLFRDSLHFPGLEVRDYHSGTGPEVGIWVAEVDALDTTIHKQRVVWASNPAAVTFKNAAGLHRVVEGVVFMHNASSARIWEIPGAGVGTHHVASLMFEEAGAGPADGPQNLSGIDCALFNGGQLETAVNSGGILTLTANGPFGLQSLDLKPGTTLGAGLRIGTENYPMPALDSSNSGINSATFSLGWHPDGYARYECF